MEILCRILSVPHNVVLDLNNVMCTLTSQHGIELGLLATM